MLPASALPVIVGVLSFLGDRLVKEVGTLGAAVSTVMAKAEEVDDVLPAASVAVVVKEYVPSPSAEDVIEKAPFPSAVAEPTNAKGEEVDDVLPAASVAVAVNEKVLLLRAEEVIEKAPFPLRVEPL